MSPILLLLIVPSSSTCMYDCSCMPAQANMNPFRMEFAGCMNGRVTYSTKVCIHMTFVVCRREQWRMSVYTYMGHLPGLFTCSLAWEEDTPTPTPANVCIGQSNLWCRTEWFIGNCSRTPKARRKLFRPLCSQKHLHITRLSLNNPALAAILSTFRTDLLNKDVWHAERGDHFSS